MRSWWHAEWDLRARGSDVPEEIWERRRENPRNYKYMNQLKYTRNTCNI